MKELVESAYQINELCLKSIKDINEGIRGLILSFENLDADKHLQTHFSIFEVIITAVIARTMILNAKDGGSKEELASFAKVYLENITKNVIDDIKNS